MEQHFEKVEAFKGLLGLETLPSDGKQASAAAQRFSSALLSTIRPAPIVSQVVQQHAHSRPQLKSRFIDVSTGMRLRYVEWRGGEDVLLLLHDVGEACEAWAPIAEKLHQRGYRVFALDLRGHGESQWSCGGRYSLDLMAEDIQAFILEKDLYTRPLAVVGCGLGGIVGLTLTQKSPHLVGAAVVAEFAIPGAVQAAWEVAQAPPHASGVSCTAAGGGARGRGKGGEVQGMRQRTDAVKALAAGSLLPQQHYREGGWQGALPAAASLDAGGRGMRSSEVLPWWGFSLTQGCSFFSLEECAALLCHPLLNVGPEALLPLTQAAAAATTTEAAGNSGPRATGAEAEAPEGSTVQPTEEDSKGAAQQAQLARSLQEILEGLQRPLGGAVRSALAMLRHTDPFGGGGGGWDSPEGEQLALRMDPHFFLSFDAGAVLSRMAAVRCHLLVLHGVSSPWVKSEDAACFAELAVGAAGKARAAAIPAAGHHLCTDHKEEFLAAVVAFLEGPAISCFEVGGSAQGKHSEPAAARRPELLDLKPLPLYDTLEQAKKALGPRSIPTPAVIEEALRKLRIEEGGGTSDDDEDNPRQTALAKDPSDYFGFVG